MGLISQLITGGPDLVGFMIRITLHIKLCIRILFMGCISKPIIGITIEIIHAVCQPRSLGAPHCTIPYDEQSSKVLNTAQ